MPSKFSSGKHSIAECDRCGQRYMLKELRKQVLKTHLYNVKVCPSCWDPDQPQLQLGMYPVNDPQAVREPRPDVSYLVSGVGPNGNPEGGSRIFQWGWAPVGGSRDGGITPNDLQLNITLGTVTVAVT